MSAHTLSPPTSPTSRISPPSATRANRALGRHRRMLQVRTFAAAEHARGLAARSIQRRLSALRTFYEFLVREGSSTHNPARDVRAPKQKKRLPTTLDADQMGRLLAFRADDTLSSRDKAVMELFYSSGLRLAELVSLDLASLDLKDRTVRVVGKGAKSRIVPIGRYAVEALENWLERACRAPEERRAERSTREVDAGGPRGRGLRRPRRAAALGASRAAAGRPVGTPARPRRARAPAHVPPLLRDPPARVQRQSARGAGAPRARRHRHDPGVYPPGFPAPGEGLRRFAPASAGAGRSA